MSAAAPEPGPRNSNAIAKFGYGSDCQTFQAARPDVLLVLKHAEVMQWGWLVRFEGTAAELLTAGVATAEMFEDLGKTGVKTADLPYGDRYRVRKRKAGRFELELSLFPELAADLSDPRVQAIKWYRQHAHTVESEVNKALKRMRRPRKGVMP